jgi:hypothetical protein
VPIEIVLGTWKRAAPYGESLAEPSDATGWFPAWLLLRHRGLAHLFRADEIPDAGTAARVFRHLLALLPLESQGLSDTLIAGCRTLRQLCPAFFRSYMEVVARRGLSSRGT